MIFASREFFIFLAVVLAGYHALKVRRHKYLFMLLASWAFYAWISPYYLWVIWLVTVIDYVAGLRIEATDKPRERRNWLIFSVVSNLGLLIGFKYTPFFFNNAAWLSHQLLGTALPKPWHILLPLGISYHTFQGISYTIDVYRKQIKAVPNLIDYGMFVTFFPQLAAGPIVRAIEFLPQMVQPPKVTREQVADGIWLFTTGLFKKLLIADHLDALIVTPVFTNPAAFSEGWQRWAVAAWAVQIYCDFSGYTDMALGVGKLFGFELPQNFRLPYLATNITEFWRRWHLSLSTWLRDYFYYPIGGSRVPPVRAYTNLMLVFVLCGLWHGAAWNWLAYGAVNGVLICLHRAYDRALKGVDWADRIRKSAAWKIISWSATAYQFLLILILVRMSSWENGWLMMKSLVGMGTGAATSASMSPLIPLLMAAGLFGHAVGLFQELGVLPKAQAPETLRMCAAACAIALIVTLAPGVAQSFIYIQF